MVNKDIFQANADTIRVLKAGLRLHDPVTVGFAMDRIALEHGIEAVGPVVSSTITRMMSEENWSFFDEKGNPSPLL